MSIDTSLNLKPDEKKGLVYAIIAGFIFKKDYHDLFAEYQKIFLRYPGIAKYFLKEDGSCYVKGETFRQPALAKTHMTMANEGAGSFYKGKLAQAMFIGFSDEYLPDWQQISKELAARRVREIELTKALPVPMFPEKTVKHGETNHLSVVDAEGNAVALTQSIGPPFGSKVANPELGFLYAYSYNMADHPLQYHREKSSQSPTIVFQNDRPFIVIGAAGSVRIPASIVQTLVDVIDHKLSFEEAVSLPRIFLTDEELHLEDSQLPKSTILELQKLGYNIKTHGKFDGYFGRIHAIFIDHLNNKVYGAADPRDYGASGGY